MHAEPVAPHRQLDTRSLPPEYVDRILARVAVTGATKSGLKSEQLGCIAVLGIAGAIAVIAGVSRFANAGFDWLVVALPALGVLFLLGAGAMLQARKTAPIPEFTLTTHAYHLVSPGDGSLEAFCMPLCSEVHFTTVLLNGLYNMTELTARFGMAKVVLTDVLQPDARERPWAGSERFSAFLGMMEAASRDLTNGRWAKVSGADLLPGIPPASTVPSAETLRQPPGSRTG
ncbi:MAG: hypothetical protein IPI67_37490 [Myxococcales bacterium]|nr:hypothetical protein [Myxococcales bacterium]